MQYQSPRVLERRLPLGLVFSRLRLSRLNHIDLLLDWAVAAEVADFLAVEASTSKAEGFASRIIVLGSDPGELARRIVGCWRSRSRGGRRRRRCASSSGSLIVRVAVLDAAHALL
jgi:hypothetical protein